MIECLFTGQVVFNGFAATPRQPIPRALVTVTGATGDLGNISFYTGTGETELFPSCETDRFGVFSIVLNIDPMHVSDVVSRALEFSFAVCEWDNELKRLGRSRFRRQHFVGHLIPILNWRRVADGNIPDLRNPADLVGFATDLYAVCRRIAFPGLPTVGNPSPDFVGSFCSKRVEIRA
ncbi:MAG: hypothetical protein KA791_12910 [Flavobacteriales bacterium]|nr:hypothetical protein [Flavobacteriales bacterium]